MILNLGHLSKLDKRETVVTDGGYRGSPIAEISGVNAVLFGRIRARNEAINRRLKTFKAVDTMFRHIVELYGICFLTVAQVVQMEFKCGARLLNV